MVTLGTGGFTVPFSIPGFRVHKNTSIGSNTRAAALGSAPDLHKNTSFWVTQGASVPGTTLD